MNNTHSKYIHTDSWRRKELRRYKRKMRIAGIQLWFIWGTLKYEAKMSQFEQYAEMYRKIKYDRFGYLV